MGRFLFRANGRALSMERTEGSVKMIADAETDVLLGVHIVGPHASELLAEAALAVEQGLSAEQIARTIHAHPTLSEVMKEAALAVHKASHSRLGASPPWRLAVDYAPAPTYHPRKLWGHSHTPDRRRHHAGP